MKTIPLQALYPHKVNHVAPKQAAEPKTKFKELLNKSHQTQMPHLTKHASERLAQRNIQFTNDQWQMIHDKMQEAKGKGLKDSLVLTKNAALIVNVNNNTVITALGRNEAASHIFTNINGTILIDG